MKWKLGIGRNTSTIQIWENSGRVPVAISLLKQIFGYVKRLIELVRCGSTSLVALAFKEQANLKLKWYEGMSRIYSAATNKTLTIDEQISPMEVQQKVTSLFITRWNEERHLNRKLILYNTIKSEFKFEGYLYEGITQKEVSCLARFRTSTQKLRVETGRYNINGDSQLNRACEECTDLISAEYLSEFPFFSPIIEDEFHVLRECPKYHDIRSKLDDTLKTNLFADIFAAFSDTQRIAKFIRKIMNRRFPQQVQPKRKEKNIKDDSAGRSASNDKDSMP